MENLEKLGATIKELHKEFVKKGNIISEKDEGDYVLQIREVDRRGMTAPARGEMKKPKTSDAFKAIYGDGQLLRMANATLCTETDDALEKTGKPISEEKKFKTAIKSATDEQKEAIAKILGLSVTDAGVKLAIEKKMESIAKGLKKSGFAK